MFYEIVAVLFFISQALIQAEYKCRQSSEGYGVSNGRTYMGVKYTMSDCVTACIRRRSSDMWVDGVTYHKYRRFCYCERWMKSYQPTRGYSTCFLVYVKEESALSSEYSCNYQSGAVNGKTEFYVGRTPNTAGCTVACLERKKIDHSINGILMNNVKMCSCRKGATGIVNGNVRYQSCVLKRKKTPTTCPLKSNHVVNGKYFYVGKMNNTAECVKACIRKKWIDRTVNSITYSKTSDLCYCARSSNSMKGSSKDWNSCFLQSSAKFVRNCGISPFKPNNVHDSNGYDDEETFHSKRIVGGMTSSAHAWPWQIGLYKNKKFICGGTIVSPRLIITAAHCLEKENLDDYSIMLGDHNRKENEESEDTEKVAGMMIHNYDLVNRNNDIAVLRLQGTIKFSDNVFPACLPTRNEQVKAGTRCYISGWGRVIGTGRFSDVLKYLPLTILTNQQCQKKNKMFHLTQDMICGMNTDSLDDTSCQGDSGGPLVCQREDGGWVLQGVISHGSADCEGTEAHPVFTRVSSYIDWILKM